MPQLIPRTDQVGWITPALSEIIEASPVRLHTEQEKSEQIAMFRAQLAQLGIVAQVMDIKFNDSHLRYHLRPAGESLASNSYEQFIADLRQAVPEIKRLMGAVAVEVLVSPQKPLIVQILVRLATYKNLEIRTIYREHEFIENESTTALPLGYNLDQELVMVQLENLRHLLIVGSATNRYQLLANLLGTLIMFNTPLELRYALIGQDVEPFSQLSQTPHVLGGTLTTIRELRRLLDGLAKHLGQRKQQFGKLGTTSLDEYNSRLGAENQKPFPRLLIVIDTIPFEEDWVKQREGWFSTLYRLVKEGPAVGIYVILTTSSVAKHHLPPQLMNLFKSQIGLKSALNQMTWRESLPSMPLPFIDVVYQGSTGKPTPIELPEIDDNHLTTLVRYWRQMTAKRSMVALAQGREKSTGDTGLLTLRQDARLKTARAKQQQNQQTRQELSGASLSTPILQPKPASLPPQTAILEKSHRQAGALAAYLGWLSIGPLVDVLDLSLEEARSTIDALQDSGVLERGSGPIWRFLRLDNN